MQRKNPFLAEIKKLRAIEDRLASNRNFFSCEDAYRMVRDKASHLEVRASILERRLESVPRVMRDLLTLHYHRYSQGLYSAVKDLR